MADTTNMELMKTVGYVDPELKEVKELNVFTSMLSASANRLCSDT